MQQESLSEARQFEVAVPQAVVAARIGEYLVQAGYCAKGKLEFERGSARGTPFAFTPKKWHSVVNLDLVDTASGTYVKATFNVNTTGQMISAHETLFWDSEIEGLESAASGRPVVTNAERFERTSRQNWISAAVLLGMMILGVGVPLAALLVFSRSIPHYLDGLILAGGLALGVWLWTRYQNRLDKRILREEGMLPPPPVKPS